MSFDLVVRGGSVLGGTPVDVGVVDGRIAALEPGLAGAAAEVIDATGLLVLPGAVDAHVHLNDPRGPYPPRSHPWPAPARTASPARSRSAPRASRPRNGRPVGAPTGRVLRRAGTDTEAAGPRGIRPRQHRLTGTDPVNID